MTGSLLTLWLGLVIVAVGLFPVHPLLLLIPGLAAVAVGLTVDEEA